MGAPARQRIKRLCRDRTYVCALSVGGLPCCTHRPPSADARARVRAAWRPSQVGMLGRFLSVREPNLRCLAMDNMARLAEVPAVVEAVG